MKIFLLCILTLCFGFYVKSQNSFSTGYREGFPIGYCYYAGLGCLAPLTPMVPMPEIGESSNSYIDGYNRGLLDGIKKYNEFKSTSIYPNQSKNLNPYSNPQVIPEFKPFTPDLEFYQMALSQMQNNYNAANIKKQNAIDEETKKLIDNYMSPENKELRKQYIKLCKAQYNSFKFYPKEMKNGIYSATVINEPVNKDPEIIENCSVIVQNNQIIAVVEKLPITGNYNTTYNRSYFPSIILNDLEDYIEQSYPIENGKGIYKWNVVNGYKIKISGTLYQVYFNEFLNDYNLAQDMLNQLKTSYNLKKTYDYVKDGWHTAYVTNNVDLCALRNVYVKNGKVIKWIGKNGYEFNANSGGQIFKSKTTVSVIFPPQLDKPLYTNTFLVKSRTEIFDFYFIDL